MASATAWTRASWSTTSARLPLLIQLFEQLGIATAPSDMSFSVRCRALIWNGRLSLPRSSRKSATSCARLLGHADRPAALQPRLHPTGAERRRGPPGAADWRLPARAGFGAAFRDWYLLPMVACIWSCPTLQMLAFPVRTLIRFATTTGSCRWRTGRNGSPCAAARGTTSRPCCRPSALALWARRCGQSQRHEGQRHGDDRRRSERFDRRARRPLDQSLALLQDASSADGRCWAPSPFQPNRRGAASGRAPAHAPRCLGGLNYERAAGIDATPAAERVCLHYLLNRLQPALAALGRRQPQPRAEPDPALVLRGSNTPTRCLTKGNPRPGRAARAAGRGRRFHKMVCRGLDALWLP